MNAMIWIGVLYAMGSTPTEPVPMTAEHWKIGAQSGEFVEHLGRPALRLQGGYATAVDIQLTDGILEFDIAFRAERGFSGACFRMVDEKHHEHLYLRPHQSGHPDSCQYTPVFHGVSAWQLYHGSGYGASLSYHDQTWIPVRIEVEGHEAEIFIQDLSQPAIVVERLHQTSPGKLFALSASSFAPAWFSDVRITETDADEPQDPVMTPEPSPTFAKSGLIPRWGVSDAIPLDSVAPGKSVDPVLSSLTIHRLDSDPKGLLNLAKVQGVQKDKDTTLVAVNVRAERAQLKRFKFGYSDRAVVFLNGRRLYEGDNTYRSRDFRFLGTMGFFDALWLPLEKGPNELVIAVSESFGGWGLQGAFEDPRELSVEPLLSPVRQPNIPR